jgi:hypothetical protein
MRREPACRSSRLTSLIISIKALVSDIIANLDELNADVAHAHTTDAA